jgi:3-oxoacyl-[acyl-carrier protein] reductase
MNGTADAMLKEIARLVPVPGTRVAIVGGCGGIGRAVTEAAIDLDLRVCVLDLPQSIEANPPADDTFAIAMDATDEAAVQSAFQRVADKFGGLDALINLPGFANRNSAVADIALDEWDATIRGSLQSAFLCCRAGLSLLRQSPAGAIVNIASGQAVRPLAGFGPYSSAKAAVIALTKTLALEAAPVRANVVAPGAVNTAFFTGGTGRIQHASTFDMAAYARTVPLGRPAEPADVAGPILFLIGPGARFINGQVLHINGGGLMP